MLIHNLPIESFGKIVSFLDDDSIKKLSYSSSEFKTKTTEGLNYLDNKRSLLFRFSKLFENALLFYSPRDLAQLTLVCRDVKEQIISQFQEGASKGLSDIYLFGIIHLKNLGIQHNSRNIDEYEFDTLKEKFDSATNLLAIRLVLENLTKQIQEDLSRSIEQLTVNQNPGILFRCAQALIATETEIKSIVKARYITVLQEKVSVAKAWLREKREKQGGIDPSS